MSSLDSQREGNFPSIGDLTYSMDNDVECLSRIHAMQITASLATYQGKEYTNLEQEGGRVICRC